MLVVIFVVLVFEVMVVWVLVREERRERRVRDFIVKSESLGFGLEEKRMIDDNIGEENCINEGEGKKVWVLFFVYFIMGMEWLLL